MKAIPVLQKTLILLSLLYLTLFLPTLIATYSPKWYEYNYEITDIKNNINKTQYQAQISNLISYLTYREELNENWSEKEKQHYSDVRNLYLLGVILTIISITILITLAKKNSQFISKSTIANIIILAASSITILLTFEYFWDTIFHSLLFNNQNYLMNYNDLSYYIFPLEFFSNTVTFITFISIILNAAIYAFLKTQKLIKLSRHPLNK